MENYELLFNLFAVIEWRTRIDQIGKTLTSFTAHIRVVGVLPQINYQIETNCLLALERPVN